MQVVISAEAPAALTRLCGVTLLERLLRILQRLDCRSVTIVSSTPQEIRAAIEPPSWARREVAATIVAHDRFEFRRKERVLLLPGDLYCDARLIAALLRSRGPAVLIDSDPPERLRPLLSRKESGAAVFDDRADAVSDTIDAATVPAYVRGMRRSIRPVFFPAPSPTHLKMAEEFVLDTAQNGALDFPAIVHSPIETQLVKWLCRTPITPNQITACGLLVGTTATVLFARGHLGWGMLPALAFGVIDGLDGKQARVKIETTPAGKREHFLDAFVELSWWAAFAFSFWRNAQLPHAWLLFAIIAGAEVVDQFAKRIAHRHIDSLLDDHSPFDRAVRLIGARRNIYIWAMAVSVVLGAPAQTYQLCAAWGAITAGTHLVRAIMLASRARTSSR